MNTNIAMQIPTSTVKDVGEIAAMAESNKAKQMQNELTRQEMDIRAGEVEAQKNFNALMDQAGGDYNKALDMAPDWRTKEVISGKLSQQRASQEDAQMKQLERAQKAIEFGAQMMSGATDQASYDMALQRMQQWGMDTKTMPTKYDPAFVKNAMNQAMTFKDRIAQNKLELEARRVEQGDQRLGLMEQRLMQQNQGGGVDTTKGWTIKETANGLVRVNEYTGAVEPVQMNGQTLQGKPSASSVGGGKKLSATAEKELFEADDMVVAGENVLSALDQALALNDKAYSGIGATERATIRSNLPGDSEGANATVELNNIMQGQALESLKTTFGAAPTEGERKILLELQASADKTPTQRAAIIKRAKELAGRRVEINRKKADALRAGEYQSGSYSAGSPPTANQQQAPAAPTAPNVSNW